MVSYDFSGKRYIVTGASSGIGRSVAIALSNSGGIVILAGRNENELEETRKRMQGDGHVILVADLSREDFAAEELLSCACNGGKKLDGLVYSAGIPSVLPINRITRERIDECMSVNTYAFLELVRQMIRRRYRAERMSIVAISSIQALQPGKCETLYAMSKAALNVAVQAMAMELAGKNIRINSVCPGATQTRMLEKSSVVNLDRQLLGMLSPEQIASCVLFLLNDMSSAMTGRVLLADGGRLL